jgi:hypothetical protein
VLIELSTQYDEIKIEFDKDLNVSSKTISGFKKFRIWNTKKGDYNIFFNVTNPEIFLSATFETFSNFISISSY